MVFLRILVGIVGIVSLSACVSTDQHIWTTDLAAKNVVIDSFPLKERVRIGKITRHTENAPKNAENAIRLSFKDNGFVASTSSNVKYILYAKIIEYADRPDQRSPQIIEAAKNIDINDDAVLALNQYVLKHADSLQPVRNLSILTVYDKASFSDGILVSCEQCDLKNLPSANSDSDNEQKPPINLPENAIIAAPGTTNSRVSGGVILVGAFAAIVAVAVLSGGRILPYQSVYLYSGGSPAYGTAKYAPSIREGRAFKHNLRAAVEILSKENL